MKTIFDTCQPRDEVLTGELRDQMFAARLRDVVEGSADPIYGDAKRFFAGTYPTDGLKTLLREVVGRLSGKEPGNSPFIRLETSFGGGKSHNLIATYHVSQGHADGLPENILPRDWVPTKPWPTAGVVGSDGEPADGIDHGTFRTRTLWGEIAFQIGRCKGNAEESYNAVRKSDTDLVAPGTNVLEKLLGDGPALIMLDEIALYLRKAKAVATANGQSNLAEQTVAFLMSLIEYATSKPKVCVVLTLADSSDAFAKETDELRQDLAEMRRVSARQERVITPTGETEISKIVTHRLFRSIDRKAAKETAEAFHAYYSQLEAKGADIPQRAMRSDYTSEMEQDYPFHPEFLTTLNRKTSTIPNFQKTRGALRLLARVVRQLWATKPADAHLICIHHLDLGLDDIANDLTSRLERPAFRSVIEADIVSPKKGNEAHAQSLDRKWTGAGKPPYARRLATSVLLHSLSQTATGVDPAELLLAVLQTGDDPAHIKKTLSLMLGEEKGDPGTAFWFLHYDGHRYRFKTEPSLEKVIHDEVPLVGRVKAKGELDDRIQRIWRKGTFKPKAFPTEAADLDDDATEPKLAIVHYDAASTTAANAAVPELVTKLFDHAGTMQGYRTYKNNVVFLVADKDHVERMVDVTQRHLAVRRIVGDTDRLGEFSDEQKKKLKAMDEAAELEVRVAITRAYRHLYYPSADAPKNAGGLARETLPAEHQGDVSGDQSGVVLKVLKQLQKVLTADDAAMAPAYVKSKAWPHGQDTLTTEDLRREFAKRIGLKILLDLNQLKKTVKQGCTQGTWVYFDATEQLGYGKVSPAPMVQVSEEATLYTPEEAQRIKLKIKGETTETAYAECPLCGKPECVCEAAPPDYGSDEKSKRLHVKVEGSAAQVFQKIADEFYDKKRSTIGRLVITSDGAGKEAASDARALGLAIPQLGKGEYRVEQRFNAEFTDGAQASSFSLTFSGPWDRYKRVKSLTDAFGQEAAKLTVSTKLHARYPDGLDVGSTQFQAMRDIFNSLGVGKLAVEVEEAEAAKEKAQ
ncbi:MAG: ATP-binding protein [Planctomycetes bacterium]|nr:ATP-binding protein [Planctomycetota bacterium]